MLCIGDVVHWGGCCALGRMLLCIEEDVVGGNIGGGDVAVHVAAVLPPDPVPLHG